MKKNSSLFNKINTIILFIVCLITLIPFLLVVAVAFSDEKSIALKGYRLFPDHWSLAAFNAILGNGSTVFDAYKVTLFVTVIGTLFAVFITSMMGYALSRKNLKYRNIINMIAYIPMVFYGGLVPFYIVLLKLHFNDNIFGLIIPMLLNPFNLFLILNFFRGLPDSVIESAKIDGAGEFLIYRSIVMRLALPGLATITLFYVLAYWNDFTLALLLINNTKLYPLQYLLRMVLLRVTYVSAAMGSQSMGNIPSESTKMATVVITIGPVILVYPFIQKYFIKGITIGAVKG
jgi:putative aldouronate transport system permease protein